MLLWRSGWNRLPQFLRFDLFNLLFLSIYQLCRHLKTTLFISEDWPGSRPPLMCVCLALCKYSITMSKKMKSPTLDPALITRVNIELKKGLTGFVQVNASCIWTKLTL